MDDSPIDLDDDMDIEDSLSDMDNEPDFDDDDFALSTTNTKHCARGDSYIQYPPLLCKNSAFLPRNHKYEEIMRKLYSSQ